jgi:hypothetical protein
LVRVLAESWYWACGEYTGEAASQALHGSVRPAVLCVASQQGFPICITKQKQHDTGCMPAGNMHADAYVERLQLPSLIT